MCLFLATLVAQGLKIATKKMREMHAILNVMNLHDNSK